MGHAWILLPVNDDWIGRRLISIATTFLLTAATEWAVKETGKWKKLALWGEKNKKNTNYNKLNRRSHHFSLTHPHP